MALLLWARPAAAQAPVPLPDATPDHPALKAVSALRSLQGTGSSPISRTFTLSLPLGERQALSLTAERVRLATYPDALKEHMAGQPYQKLKAYPLTLEYSYTLRDQRRDLVPVVGVGVTAFGCLAKARRPTGPARMDTDEGRGFGYAALASMALRKNLRHGAYLQAQARYRFVNRTAYAEDPALPTALPTFDFAIGLGVRVR